MRKGPVWLLGSVGLIQCATLTAETLPDVYRIGGYYGDDSSYALMLNGDWAIGDVARFNLGGAYVHASGETTDLDSVQGLGGIEVVGEHWSTAFDLEYRDDESSGLPVILESRTGTDTIKSTTVRLRTAYQSEYFRGSLGIGRRRIDITLDLPRVLQPYIDSTRDTDSTEYSASVRYSPGSDSNRPVALYANGRYYDYDEPIQSLWRLDESYPPAGGGPIVQQIRAAVAARLRSLNFATVRLANNFLDYSMTFGADYSLDEHSLNLEYYRQRVTGDGTIIDGVEAGWVLPLASASDLEIRAGGVHGEETDWIYYGSLTLSFYH